MTNLDDINKELAKVGVNPIKDIDPCPERTRYMTHLSEENWSDKDWVSLLKELQTSYFISFYKHFASQNKHLLFEKSDASTYWQYNKETGVYDELTTNAVISLVVHLLIYEGFDAKATEASAKVILTRYRAQYPERGVAYNDFDQETELFHAKNGWVNLTEGTLHEHTPAILSRRISDVEYDPKATCPKYDEFIDKHINVSKDVVRVIDQFSGLILSPEIKYQKMLTIIGRAGSGKSTLLEAWKHILGDMATQKRLTELSGDSSRFIGASLADRTLCWFDEVDVKKSEMSNNLGTLITGDSISVERKGINHISTVDNKLKCVLTANTLPIHSTEHGIYRRLILIYFNYSFNDSNAVNNNIKAELQAEASGILNRMIKGLRDLKKMNGFTMIEGHEDLIEEYKSASDPVAEFLSTYFVPDPKGDISSKDLFNAYKSFKDGDSYVRGLTPQKFGLMMRAQPLVAFSKIEARRTNSGNRWIGLRLKDDFEFDSLGLIKQTF